MITILKNNTTPDIQIKLAEGFDYSGATIEVAYQGAKRTFTGAKAGQTLNIRYSAAETAAMMLGAWPISVRIKTANEELYTVPTLGMKINVTDCVDEVCEGGIIVVNVKGGLCGVDLLPDRFTENELREKINEIISKNGGGTQ